MGKLLSLDKQRAKVDYYLATSLSRLLDCIAYTSHAYFSTDLKNNKRVHKALNQLKNAAYVLKSELEKARQ